MKQLVVLCRELDATATHRVHPRAHFSAGGMSISTDLIGAHPGLSLPPNHFKQVLRGVSFSIFEEAIESW